ncbi:MAG: imidazole glycerol phosphate synthase subunit HisH [Nonlabens sp.]
MIAIVKYNAGNIGSVTNALNRLGVKNKVTDDPTELQAADKVIFPGVGEAGTAMRYLKERGLDETLKNLKQPVLGICLGMQLMCKHSEEGDTECLGIFDTVVKRFPLSIDPKSPLAPNGGKSIGTLKVPHMGWNSLGTIRSRKFESVEDYIQQVKFPPLGGQGGQATKFQFANQFTYPTLKPLAAENRKAMTEAETILWSQIKESKLGVKFQRQHVINSYIVDFLCLELKLIIEVDGKIHLQQKQADAIREQELSDLGFTIVRFTNEEVKKSLTKSLNILKGTIEKAYQTKGSPLPPKGGSPSIDLQKQSLRKSNLLRKIKTTDDVYYVHSYYAEICESTTAGCHYILPFSSVLEKENFYATQFHPEKSAGIGEQILKNFISL